MTASMRGEEYNVPENGNNPKNSTKNNTNINRYPASEHCNTAAVDANYDPKLAHGFLL